MLSWIIREAGADERSVLVDDEANIGCGEEGAV